MKKIINEQPDSSGEWIKVPPPLKGKVDTTKFDVSSNGDWYKIKENITMNEHMIMLEQPDDSGNWVKVPDQLKGKINTTKFKVSDDGNWYIDKTKLLKPDTGTEKKFKTNDGKEYTVGMLGNDIIQFADGVWKDTKGWTTENIIKIKEKLYNIKRGDSVYDKNKQTTKFPLEQGAYTTKGDPYQYKVVNGQWFAKSLENRGKIFTNWVSLANNVKATSILDKRHPNARTVKPKVDNTQQKAGETQAKYKDQFGQMSKDAENLPKTIFGTKGETNPTDNAERLNVNNPIDNAERLNADNPNDL